jgi:hypothetical protein
LNTFLRQYMDMENRSSSHKTTESDKFERLKQAYISIIPAILWYYIVGIGPFVLIVTLRGWDETFRTGEAYLYLIGLVVAVFGEVLIEFLEEGRKRLKEVGKDWGAIIFSSCILLAIVVWGAFLVVNQPKIQNPTTSWVQITIFFFGLSYSGALRFFLKKGSVFRAIDKILHENDENAASSEEEVTEASSE